MAGKVAMQLHVCSSPFEGEISGRTMEAAMAIGGALADKSSEVAKIVLDRNKCPPGFDRKVNLAMTTGELPEAGELDQQGNAVVVFVATRSRIMFPITPPLDAMQVTVIAGAEGIRPHI
jgi:hypothetical protein